MIARHPDPGDRASAAAALPSGDQAGIAEALTRAGCLRWPQSVTVDDVACGSGGSYGFMRLGLGEGVAFLGSGDYEVSIWAANGAIVVAGVSYATRLVPVLGATSLGQPIAAFAGIWLLTIVNLRGLRAAGAVQLLTSIVKVLPFVAVIALAFRRLARGGMSTLPPLGFDSITFAGMSGAMGLTLYAMLGLESAARTVVSERESERGAVARVAPIAGRGFDCRRDDPPHGLSRR